MTNTIPSIAELINEAQDAPAFFTKNSAVGDTISGQVTAISLRQVRNFKTNLPETWDDGTPQLQIVVVVKDENLAKGEDDGSRSIYVKWWSTWRHNFAKAVREAGQTDVLVGGTFQATYVGEGDQTDPNLSAPKLFDYTYTAPVTAAV